MTTGTEVRVWLPSVRAHSGTDVFTQRLADGLRDSGVDVVQTWYSHWYELLPELMRWKGLPRGVDVIHANSWNAHVFVGRGVPVVATVHHLVHDPAYRSSRSLAQAFYHRWNLRWREMGSILRSDVVTAVSHYVADTVRVFSGRRDVRVVSNWVDTDLYRPDPNYRRDDEAPFRLLLVGNRGKRKGSDLLEPLSGNLGAAFELRCTGGLRDVRGWASPGLSQLGRLAEHELIQEYQQCDAVVSLSRYEGFGYTALEAMACAKPVVAFDTSALREVVKNGETGLLVGMDDVQAMVQACLKLKEDGEYLHAMGRAGRARAVSMADKNLTIRRYIEIYESLVDKEKAL